jgi:hypothetical protein
MAADEKNGHDLFKSVSALLICDRLRSVVHNDESDQTGHIQEFPVDPKIGSAFEWQRQADSSLRSE